MVIDPLIASVVLLSLSGFGYLVKYWLSNRKKPSARPVIREGSGRPRILLVDDERQFTNALATTLNGDYDVRAFTRAADAEHAITNARDFNFPFAIALIDYNLLSQWSGMDLIKLLRINQPDCFVILISGGFVPNADVKLADDFWIKSPVEVVKWKARVNALLYPPQEKLAAPEFD